MRRAILKLYVLVSFALSSLFPLEVCLFDCFLKSRIHLFVAILVLTNVVHSDAFPCTLGVFLPLLHCAGPDVAQAWAFWPVGWLILAIMKRDDVVLGMPPYAWPVLQKHGNALQQSEAVGLLLLRGKLFQLQEGAAERMQLSRFMPHCVLGHIVAARLISSLHFGLHAKKHGGDNFARSPTGDGFGDDP